MNVALLAHTPDPERLLYIACRTCYSPDCPSSITIPELTKQRSLIKRTLYSGHHSVLEHISFTFAIEGVSRAMSHQLVRHRLASYSQQSQRYVTFTPDSIDYVTPDTIEKVGAADFDETIKAAAITYEELTANGVPAEDARFILPNATVTHLVVTMNYRELLAFMKLRLCHRAQWEIKQCAELMRNCVSEVSEFLGQALQPKCQHLGYCDEDKPCGKFNFSIESWKVAKERKKLWDI